ncbi:Protein kinase C beta type [Clarias magur]|uniref:Protein kinase C beta type n=1 Tax=Clarias magur TaxID=1594786 RepID=A0A8J4T7Q1_CLAMG|nr:Protein kinase C beta type [Clarias magur]
MALRLSRAATLLSSPSSPQGEPGQDHLHEAFQKPRVAHHSPTPSEHWDHSDQSWT